MTDIKKFMKELAEDNDLVVGSEKAWCSSDKNYTRCYVDFYSKKCFYTEFNAHEKNIKEISCSELHKMKIGDRVTDGTHSKSFPQNFNGYEYFD